MRTTPDFYYKTSRDIYLYLKDNDYKLVECRKVPIMLKDRIIMRIMANSIFCKEVYLTISSESHCSLFSKNYINDCFGKPNKVLKYLDNLRNEFMIETIL